MRKRVRRSPIAAVVAALFAAGLATSGVIATAGTAGTSTAPSLLSAVPELLDHTIPSVVASATSLGPIAPSTPMTLIAPLTLDHQRQLDQYVQAEYTAGSPDYHHFLNLTGFANYFGATTAHVNAVVGVLRNLGFSVVTPSANRLYVEFTGAASLVEQAFSTIIDRLQLPASLTSLATNVVGGLTTFTANVTNLTLPAGLAHLVSGVVGLNSLDVPHNNLSLPTAQARARAASLPRLVLPETGVDGGAAPCLGAITGAGYTAPQLAAAYNFNGLYAQNLLGQDMTASLVEFNDYHDSNVDVVQRCYGDLGTKVNRVSVDGGTGDGTPGPAETEDMADIGTMLEMLPKLKQLDVYVAPVTATAEFDLYNAFVTNDSSPVLSSSWGNCEENGGQGGARLFNLIAEEAAAQGQQIFQAAGDSGAVDCRGTPPPTGDSISVMTEAASPYVTGVGGTDLGQRSALGLGHDEVTWNDAGAGGGGQSSYWTMPAWQAVLPSARTAPGATNTACGAPAGTLCREIPDISANADPDFGMQTDTKFQYTTDVGSLGYSMYCGTPNCTLLSQLGLPIIGPLPVAPPPLPPLPEGIGGTLPVAPPPLPPLPEGIGGWYPIGGTSLAAPLTAAAAVLWDQKGFPIGFLNPSLYKIAADPASYARDFYDITSDSNSAQYDLTDCPSGCNAHQLYQAAPGYDMASGLGSFNATNLGADLFRQEDQLVVTPSAVTVYGYTHGPPTTQPVAVSGVQLPYSVHTSAAWLHATGGILHDLTWSADPTGLAPGTYTGTITLDFAGLDPPGTATLQVTYVVTPPASMSVSPGTLNFSESAVDANGAPTAASCGSSLWLDELEGSVGGAVPTRAQVAPSLQTVHIANDGPAGSVLHWSAVFGSVTGGWLSQDLAPPNAVVAQAPTAPIVNTQGAQSAGTTASVPLASIANVSTLGGYSDMNQGTYHGLVLITDLADPTHVIAVPATLKLGDGTHTPVVTASPASLSATVPHDQMVQTALNLSDGAKSCGYAYSVSSDVPWAIVDPGAYLGTVAPGGGQASVPVRFDASGMAPGTYTGTITIQSSNAEPNPHPVPVTLHVT